MPLIHPSRPRSSHKRFPGAVFAWLATTCCVLGTPIAAAQAPVAPSIEQLRRPGDTPLIAPEPRPAPKPPGIVIPPPAATPSSPTLSLGARVQARAFRFVGNTVVADADLQAIAAPFVGLQIGNAELDDLRVRLTRRYVDAGYINSGAVIPDQDIGGGVITFEIVEGRLTEIVVGGDNRFRAGYLRDVRGRHAAVLMDK